MKKIEIKLNGVERISDVYEEINKKVDKTESCFVKVELDKKIEISTNGINDVLRQEDGCLKECIFWNIDNVQENILYISKRYRNFEKEKQEELKKWSTITEIEKVADFVARFIKETRIESKEIISDIMDNLHNDWQDRMDNDLEFKNVEFVKVDAKDFSKEIKRINSSMEHSWAGSESNSDESTLLYGNKDNFEFGEQSDYQYYNNGNQTANEEKVTEGKFNINETYVILVRNNQYSDYNNNYYDNTTYKCIVYVGDEKAYDFEHKEIISKYNIGNKVIQQKLMNGSEVI